jgi:hypothetical protein
LYRTSLLRLCCHPPQYLLPARARLCLVLHSVYSRTYVESQPNSETDLRWPRLRA